MASSSTLYPGPGLNSVSLGIQTPVSPSAPPSTESNDNVSYPVSISRELKDQIISLITSANVIANKADPRLADSHQFTTYDSSESKSPAPTPAPSFSASRLPSQVNITAPLIDFSTRQGGFMNNYSTNNNHTTSYAPAPQPTPTQKSDKEKEQEGLSTGTRVASGIFGLALLMGIADQAGKLYKTYRDEKEIRAKFEKTHFLTSWDCEILALGNNNQFVAGHKEILTQVKDIYDRSIQILKRNENRHWRYLAFCVVGVVIAAGLVGAAGTGSIAALKVAGWVAVGALPTGWFLMQLDNSKEKNQEDAAEIASQSSAVAEFLNSQFISGTSPQYKEE